MKTPAQQPYGVVSVKSKSKEDDATCIVIFTIVFGRVRQSNKMILSRALHDIILLLLFQLTCIGSVRVLYKTAGTSRVYIL